MEGTNRMTTGMGQQSHLLHHGHHIQVWSENSVAAWLQRMGWARTGVYNWLPSLSVLEGYGLTFITTASALRLILFLFYLSVASLGHELLEDRSLALCISMSTLLSWGWPWKAFAKSLVELNENGSKVSLSELKAYFLVRLLGKELLRSEEICHMVVLWVGFFNLYSTLLLVCLPYYGCKKKKKM